jgi:hypothetical protein
MRLHLMLLFVSCFLLGINAFAQEQCVPFGGTIYGWHNGKSWIGEGNFTVGKKVMHATIVDVNTGISKQGDMWLGTETATFDFGSGNKVDLMTEFVTEHQTDAVGTSAGLFHVNETGYFANGQGKFKHAWGRFSSQGPFGPGVTLPPEIKPTANDGLFWIGQYNGMICGVEN